MTRSDIRIMIVDDDPTLGKAIRELITKLGFQAVLCNNPADALSQFRIQDCKLLIVDCLLPKMSGVDLAIQLKKDSVTEIPLILMSGIYKDKSFMKDALHKTGAQAFLPKPFNIQELESIILKSVEHLIEESSPLEDLLTKNFSPQERVQAINSLVNSEALDIPWLCCLLMGGQATGVLEFKADADFANIFFSQGKITQVTMQNPESFFGSLLIEKGYVTPQQLEAALKAQSTKKLGERLVDLNFLSPHVIDMINAEQTAIRLSRVITDKTYTVKFIEKAVDAVSASIDTESIAPFLVDWIHSKISGEWLKSRYLKWTSNATIPVQTTVNYQRLWNLSPLKDNPKLIAEFETGASLEQVIAKGAYPEEVVYQVFHILILVGRIYLKRELREVDDAAQTARLQKIWNDMQKQDYFQVLAVNRNARPAEIKKTYYELAKIFHPDKIPASASKTLKELASQVFGQMTKAYEILSDEAKRTTYLKEIEMGRAEKILQAESLMEEGMAALKTGRAGKAQEKFEEAVALRPPSSELLIHLAWAKIVGSEEGNMEKNLMQVEATLNKIPPEDRHNATYYFVKGLFQKIIGEDAAAKKNIQHALVLNPKFLEAERALRSIDSKKSKGGDIFRGDLKDVVGNLFRKK